MQNSNNNDISTLSTLDGEFKQLLSEYTSLLNTVNREILQEQQKYGSMADYLGKRITTNESDTYINEYGYARDIPLSSMVDSSCPKSSDAFNNSCQGLSDAYGATYAEDYNAICKNNNPKSDKVTAVKKSCTEGGSVCKEGGHPDYNDRCNSTSDDWTCCVQEYKDNNIHLGIEGSNECPSGMLPIPESECEASAKLVLPAGKTMGRKLQVGDSWRQVPPGCSVGGGDWAAHYSSNGSGKNNGQYTVVCKDDPDVTAQIEKTRGNAPTDATNFGCAPDFAKEWWKQHSCKTNPTSLERPGCEQVNTSIFKKGSEMSPGEPCNLAGKNIRNSTTDEVAWVDTAGTKHVYLNSKMRDNLIGCPSKVTVTLDDAKYSIVPTGSPMTVDSICLNISVNESDYIKLLNMNKQLQVLAANIVKQLDALISKDSETETEIRSKKSSIRGFLKNLKAERKNFDQNQQLLKTMKYQSEDSHVSYVSNKYHMIAWGLLVVGVGGFTIHQLTTRRSL